MAIEVFLLSLSLHPHGGASRRRPTPMAVNLFFNPVSLFNPPHPPPQIQIQIQ